LIGEGGPINLRPFPRIPAPHTTIHAGITPPSMCVPYPTQDNQKKYLGDLSIF
jgi:hypothetical protein